ncbi:acetyltransferase [Paraliobacillus quinghaiensis]|uniref:Acetyltransferase n=1 Tax=Paraliobacillus quinghaiensis TaxID=470815 RepID=A0A917WY40_9BACI|nr:GNAT family N-acetyltransferase [Paraliobacillus quinghaiensis]GGM38824.1 acetyltransferase [Paraliobacillus quinghaiensis]
MQVTQVTNKLQWEKVCQIRKEVFVEEQEVPLSDEFDKHDQDPNTKHILIEIDNQPAATGRIRIVDGKGKLERICVSLSFRKKGLGKLIVKNLEAIARDKNALAVFLHGQTHAEGFYQSLNYQTVSDVFIEDGIPHIVMEKNLE